MSSSPLFAPHPCLVLASASPSRKRVLESAGYTPLVVPADVNEDMIRTQAEKEGASPEDIVNRLAYAKAQSVARTYHNDIVVGCDSLLFLDDTLWGKPYTYEETIHRWKAQRGKVGVLLTGHCIYAPLEHSMESSSDERRVVLDAVKTEIYFGTPTDADIMAYAHSEEPYGCAGAFTLEALGGSFIDRIVGDPLSVLGISLSTLRRALYEWDINVSDLWDESVGFM